MRERLALLPHPTLSLGESELGIHTERESGVPTEE